MYLKKKIISSLSDFLDILYHCKQSLHVKNVFIGKENNIIEAADFPWSLCTYIDVGVVGLGCNCVCVYFRSKINKKPAPQFNVCNIYMNKSYKEVYGNSSHFFIYKNNCLCLTYIEV